LRAGVTIETGQGCDWKKPLLTPTVCATLVAILAWRKTAENAWLSAARPATSRLSFAYAVG
jgi:hypothetical protein